jgi:hypothetical protein
MAAQISWLPSHATYSSDSLRICGVVIEALIYISGLVLECCEPFWVVLPVLQPPVECGCHVTY